MARLTAIDSNTDVVGFYHPYCSIQGLRSCWVATTDDFYLSHGGPSLINAVLKRLPLPGPTLKNPVNRQAMEGTEAFYYARKKIENKAFNAPFWVDGGGLLYIHQLLPHPPANEQSNSLYQDYMNNIADAGYFIEKIQHRLKETFGGDYAIIVTSDHPLRTSRLWCKRRPYSAGACLKNLPSEGNIVPFAVFAPRGSIVNIPDSNVGVFAVHSPQ